MIVPKYLSAEAKHSNQKIDSTLDKCMAVEAVW
jgi:hypothetical protein